ncbi:MAG: diadenylate cyclase CdaA [Planctomycetota bacterium]
MRTTRGSSLVQALGIGLLVVGVGLYSVVRSLHLDELEQVLDAIFGVVILMLVILFQPELRRGLMRIGEHGLLRRFLGSDSQETIGEIIAAVTRMARAKQGALIVIERQTPLDQYIENAVHVDAAVGRLLLDSIFHDKGPLHDGAVIIRGDRIVAAAAILPLSENTGLAKTTGTRHRAALGMAEESDAVTVVVSEETGWISVANDGQMISRVSPNGLEDTLKARLGGQKASPEQGSTFQRALRASLTQHWGQKLIALALGLALFLAAHEKVTEQREFQVHVETPEAGTSIGVPMPELLVIQAPQRDAVGGTELHIVAPEEQSTVSIVVTGPRAQMQDLSGGIGGVLELSTATAVNRALETSEFRWGAGRTLEGLDVRWKGPAPELRVEPFVVRKVTPRPEQVHVERGELAPHLDFDAKKLRFRPNQALIRGPQGRFPAGGELALAFQRIRVGASDGDVWSGPLTLSQDLLRKGFELVEPIYVELDLHPRFQPLGDIKKDVTLVSFDPTQGDPLKRFQAPDRPVRILISAAPLLENPSEEDRTSISIALRDYVQAHTRVFVDVDRERPEGSLRATVELDTLEDGTWLEALPPALAGRIQLRDAFPFRVELHPEDTTLWLVPIPAGDGSPASNTGTGTSDGLEED